MKSGLCLRGGCLPSNTRRVPGTLFAFLSRLALAQSGKRGNPEFRHSPIARSGRVARHFTQLALCELLNQREFLLYFPMLKDREKRIEQDEIWKKICEELNWEFIPTI